jgi:hypothetical protein
MSTKMSEFTLYTIVKFAYRSIGARLSKPIVLVLILSSLVCLPATLNGLETNPARGGIEFTFDNADLVIVGNSHYLSIDVMVSSPEQNQRLGTGIVFVNYNPAVFGTNVRANNNIVVSRGSLITTNPFPFYNVIVNDNSASRVAVTFEYTVMPGYGGLLSQTTQCLLNLKFKVINTGHHAGIDFQQSMMAGEQYMDDNATLFNLVVATDFEDSLIPSQPTNIALAIIGNIGSVTWDRLLECTYSVYSADLPGIDNWQLEATGLTEPVWNYAIQGTRRFFRVIAVGNMGSNIRKGFER